jgi:hypothetical protein
MGTNAKAARARARSGSQAACQRLSLQGTARTVPVALQSRWALGPAERTRASAVCLLCAGCALVFALHVGWASTQEALRIRRCQRRLGASPVCCARRESC